MDLRKLGIAVGCVVLLGGSFAAAFAFLQSGSSAEPKGAAPRPARPEDGLHAGANENDTRTKSPEVRKQAPQESPSLPRQAPRVTRPRPRPPLTCVEATKLGEDSIGRRVTWVGEQILSQSARIGEVSGTQHVFNTRGTQGGFSFDYPFIAEEPKPLVLAAKGQNLREFRKKRWGSTGVVTVTGTIARSETLMFLSRGTRYNVPVLTDITIAISP